MEVLKNRILLGVLNDFKNDFNIDEDEAKSFESFVNYVVLSKYDSETFDDTDTFDIVDVDSNGTYGIDSFALFINDKIVRNANEIEWFRKTNRMDVRFVFIQTKRSTSVDIGDFLKFTSAVSNFLQDGEGIKIEDDLKNSKNMLDELFKPENMRLFANNKPVCDLYYATSGVKSDDEKFLGALNQQKKAINRDNPEIGEVNIVQIGADYLITSYNEIENNHTVEIEFQNNIDCGNDIEDIEQAFIGYLPVDEFIKLITDGDKRLRKNLFYENVRDFQGIDNTVNAEMSKTLCDDSKIDKFLILNNGVTIVAKDFSNIKSKLYAISNYYIVNGCQTSNVIFHNLSKIKDRTLLNIPVKIIHTRNNDVINSIIRSTNRQTPVPEEAFVSLETFHKMLQDFYKYYSSQRANKLYYERRSKEFTGFGSERIEKNRVVNLHSQIRSFVSIILGEPQLALSNNPTSILKEHKEKIFISDHKHIAYYFPSLLLYNFHLLTRKKKKYKDVNYAKYWICWIVRVLSMDSINVGMLNSSKTERNIEKAINIIDDYSNIKELFDRAINIFDKAKQLHREENTRQLNEQLVRLRSFRDIVNKCLINELK